MENWSIQSTPPVQPLIVPSTSQIQSVPRAQYPPIQPTSLVQADLTILPPPTKSVPFVKPVMLAQPSLIEPAPLPVQPISSIIKPALPSQTVGPSLPALPLVEPIPCALAAFQSILPSFESVPPATIEPDAPTLSIVQEASDMQILTEQNIEENKAVYNQECFRFIAGIFTTNEASHFGSFMKSSTEVSLIFSPPLLDTSVLLARLFVGFLHALTVTRCPVHISRFARLGEG